MKRVAGFAAAGCLLGVANAKVLKWSADYEEGRWAPAQETLAYMPFLGQQVSAPAPTSPPVQKLRARSLSDNTCAYINGDEGDPLYCAATQHCEYNSINSHIGCCDDTASFCPLWTKCYDSTDADLYSTDNGYTLWCGLATYPHCLTHIYQEESYTLLGCGVAAGTDKVYFSATTTKSGSDSEPTDGFLDTSDEPSSSSKSSTPIGPIVGGVVGGVVVIILIAVGIWLLVRKKKKNQAAAANPMAPAVGTAQAPPAGGPQFATQGAQGPQMSQQQPPNGGYYNQAAAVPAGFAPVAAADPRNSVHPSYGVSPPASPPPQSHSPGYPSQQQPTPPPPQNAQYGGAQYGQQQQGYPPPQQQQQQGYQEGYQQSSPQTSYQQHSPQQSYQPSPQSYQPSVAQGYQQPPTTQQQQPQQHAYQHHDPNQPGFVAELPTQRGDGEVRELA